jgi:hypothetical protein
LQYDGADAAQLYNEQDKENSMKYMLLIYNEEKAWAKFSEAQRQGFMGEFMKFTQQIQSAGCPVLSYNPRRQPRVSGYATANGL